MIIFFDYDKGVNALYNIASRNPEFHEFITNSVSINDILLYWTEGKPNKEVYLEAYRNVLNSPTTPENHILWWRCQVFLAGWMSEIS